jgi:hypothetical protein
MCHAPRQFRRFRDKYAILVTPVDDDLIPLHLELASQLTTRLFGSNMVSNGSKCQGFSFGRKLEEKGQGRGPEAEMKNGCKV